MSLPLATHGYIGDSPVETIYMADMKPDAVSSEVQPEIISQELEPPPFKIPRPAPEIKPKIRPHRPSGG